MTPRTRNLLTVLGLVALLAVVTLSAPLWTRLLRSTAAGEEPGEAAPAPSPSAGPEAQRTITVKLYFEAADRPGLAIEERAVAVSDDLGSQLRTVVQELLAGSRNGLRSAFVPEARVLEVFVREGTAYVDLSSEAAAGQDGQSEIMAAWAIVNSLTTNFPAVKRVQLLIDDQPASTFAGHLDISHPLLPDLSLVAGLPTTPGGTDVGPPASPAPSGAPGTTPAASPRPSPAASSVPSPVPRP